MKIRKLLKYIVLTFLLFLCQSAFAKPLNYSIVTDSESQKIILDEINSYRLKLGLRTLKLDQAISKEAENHSIALAENKIPFGHDGFEWRVSRLRHHFNNSHAFAENVAYTTMETRSVVKQWLDSVHHRENIEGNYHLTGIGIAHNKQGEVYVTQIFLKLR